jgi:hypothetical protein
MDHVQSLKKSETKKMKPPHLPEIPQHSQQDFARRYPLLSKVSRYNPHILLRGMLRYIEHHSHILANYGSTRNYWNRSLATFNFNHPIFSITSLLQYDMTCLSFLRNLGFDLLRKYKSSGTRSSTQRSIASSSQVSDGSEGGNLQALCDLVTEQLKRWRFGFWRKRDAAKEYANALREFLEKLHNYEHLSYFQDEEKS